MGAIGLRRWRSYVGLAAAVGIGVLCAAGAVLYAVIWRAVGQPVPPAAVLAGQIVASVVYLEAYIVYSLLYYRRLDPPLRAWIGTRLGVRVVWERSRYLPAGGRRAPPRLFGWSVAGTRQGIGPTNLVLHAAQLLVTVPVSLLPPALYLAAFLWLHLIHPVVAQPALFLTMAIFTRFWSYRIEPPPP